MIIAVVIGLLLGITLLLYMVREAFLNNVVHHELTFADFPETFGAIKIFFISDIHRRVISDKVINAVKGQADIIIIGGDLTEKGVPFERVRDNLKALKEVAPVYFVWGNNDYETDYRKLDATFLDYGIKVLDNTAVTFESEKGDKLCLLGIDDMSQKRDRLELAVSDADPDSFKILVSHYPKITRQIKHEHDIRLVLSGHTHGGQIHIFGYSPYRRGRIEKSENTTVLISNGYGTTGVPLRLGAPAECHLITIRHESF